MKNKIAMAVASAAALGVASLGGAQASGSGYEVRYNTSDLNRSGGAAEVYGKIRNAASDYCDNRLGHQSIVKYRAARERCVANVTDELVNKVGDRRVEELHARETGRA